MRTLLTVAMASLALVAGPASGRVGNFVLLDARGSAHELYYHGDAPAIVLSGMINDCAEARDSRRAIDDAKSRFEARGVRFLYVDPIDDRNDFDPSQLGAIPVLLDETQLVTRSLGLRRAGETLVVDPKTWEVVYRGTAEALPAALDALLAGAPLPTSKKPVAGCGLDLDGPRSVPSYAKHVAPLLTENCSICHKPGGIGPWAMTSYEMVRGFAPMIREVILTRRMPPWHADPHVGTFVGDRSLSVAEKRMLVRWIDAGAPRGSGPDPLASVEADDGEWPLAASFGPPDLVLDLPPFDVPASGVVDYQFPVVPNPLDRDVWVKAASIAAGDRSVVHHVLAGSVKEGTPPEGLDNVFQNYLIGYAPGAESLVYPEGTGVFIPKGGHFTFQLHYTPIGKTARDVTRMALYFHDEKPERILRHHVIANPAIRIPPNAPAHEEAAYYDFHKDAILFSVFPHAHYRGRSSTFTLELPSGESRLLLSVPKYDFNWQREYAFAQPVNVPAGARLVHRTVYDNSAKNPANPDPSRTVPWGLQSWDEMLYGALMYRWVDETAAQPNHDEKRAELAQMYGFMDRDMNGRLELPEMPKRMREQFAERFGEADRNADGGLDIEEFMAASRQRVSAR